MCYNIKQITPDVLVDEHICPWCIFVSNMEYNSCSSCQYGKRNGMCSDLKSRYIKLVNSGMLENKHNRKYINIIADINSK